MNQLVPAHGALPHAQSLPPGAMLLSLSGTSRTTFRVGVALWCLALAGGGFALGWWWRGRR